MHNHSETSMINHAAPSISLFISLQNCLNSISSQKPMKEVRNSIFSFVQRLGPQGQKLAITALMQALQQPQPKDKANTSYKSSLLTEMIKQYSANDNFFSYFPEIIAKVGKQNRLNQLISNLMNSLKLPINTQIAIALALYLSDRNELIVYGESQLISKLKQYCKTQKPVKLSQKLLDELLFQINISPELSNKLQEQSKVLLETAQKLYKNSQTRIYNYYRDQWQFFANQLPTIDKPMPITLKKSDILKDLGPSVSQQMDTLKAVLVQIGPLSQQDIFQCMMMMAEQKSRPDSGMDRFIIDLMYASSSLNNNKKNTKVQDIKKVFSNDLNSKKVMISWNTDNFLLYCTQNIQNIKWQNVLSNFDRENLQFKSNQHFVQIMKNFQKIKKLMKKWNLSQSIFFKKWAHPQSQEQFLYRLLSCKDPQCLFFNQTQLKKNQNSSKDTNNMLRQIWGYQDLISLYFQVCNDKKQRIKQVFEVPISRYPDLLLKTLSQIKPIKGTQYIYQIYLKLLPQFLQNDDKNVQMMQIVWNNNKQLLTKTINSLYKQGLEKKRSPLDIDKLVQIFMKIEGSLQQLLVQVDSSLTMAIALIAGKKQYISLQRWLMLKIDKNQAKFSKQILTYLQTNLLKQLQSSNISDQKQSILEQANLSIETLNKIFTVMIQKLRNDHPTSKNNQLFKKLHKECCKLFPQIAQGQIYEQAQKQCEQQIKKIYKQEISIKDAIQNLKRLKNSNKKQQRQNFASRITFLCIQLTYHHSYPEKQLMITADLFSALINENLVEKKIFQMFLHVMIQYLKQDNYQYSFSMRVIQNIKVKLAHESWFCQKLIDNDLVMKKDPQIVQQIINSIQPPKVLTVQKQLKIKQAIKLKKTPIQNIQRRIIIQPEVPYHQVPHKHQIIEYDILATLDRSKKIEIHDRQTKIKMINTICNTLSLANVDEKAKELKKVFDNQKSIKLLAYSLVFKRITITQNNGAQVFVKLLDNLPKLQKPVLNITFKVLQKWFNLSGKSISNDKKFSHFKNIGSWLGRITIGKGIPIPIYKLNLRQILKASFMQNNRISFNVPVILRILQYISLHPNIFRENSPWLKRIMCALNQVQTNLKDQQHLKSQIKAFFKSSKMNMDAVLLNQPSFLHGEEQCPISELMQKVILTEQIFKLCENLQLKNVKMMIVLVLDVSIKEIVQPVIERSVKIAKTTTMQLINKDFCTQRNGQKVKQSSICLAKQLAQPLAQITCREPLKGSITKNLKQKLKQQIQKNKGKQQQFQSLIQKIINQTVEIGCQIIKQKVCISAQKAIRTDPKLLQSIQLRNYLKQRQQNFKDDIHLSTIPAIVPQELKPSLKGITQQQYQIYNDLKKHKQKQKQYQKNSKQQSMLSLIEQKQSIENVKKSLSQQEVTEEILEKIYGMVLDQNDQQDFQYYFNILAEIKQVAPFDVWRVFKNIADIQNQPANKILHLLIKQKFFDQSVLTQLQQFQKQTKLFQQWINVPKQKIREFMVVLVKQLSSSQCNVTTFLLASLRYIVNRYHEEIMEESTQTSTCFNINYAQHFLHFVIAYYQSLQFKQDFQTKMQKVLDAIAQSLLKLPNKQPQINNQRVYFKILTNLIQVVSYQKNQIYLRQDKQKQLSQMIQNKLNELPPQKILIFHKVLSKKLSKINPLARPAFSFAWLALINNKYIIRYLLLNYEDWELYYNLLSQLLRFTNQYVTQQKLYDPEEGQAYQRFYLNIFKLFIIILHDFPSFLSEFSLYLQLILDSRFIQLKNAINSVYPSNQLSIPLKFQKREDLIQFVQKVGYPKYYKLNFDKNRLNYYLKTDPNDAAFKQKLSQQNDFFVQILVLYIGWLQENGLTQAEAFKRLIDIILSSKEQIRLKLINYSINLIRYPNYITLFFIDFIDFIIFKQTKEPFLRQLVLSCTITRMGEVPNAWGLIHVCNNFLNNKKVLQSMKISPELIQQL